MARSRGISVVVSGNTGPLRKSLKDASAELSAFGKAQAKWAQASSLAYGIAGSAATQFAISSVKAAMEDQKSQALLADQLRKTTGATSSQIAGVEDYIEKTMYATNITDDQLRPALAQLTRVTGSTAKAQELLSLATDVSVGSGRELGSVITALGKSYQGSTGALSKLGIQIDAAAFASQGFAAVSEQLTTQFGGAAAAAVDTQAGRLQNLTIRFDELKEQLGTQLLPVINDVTGALLDLVTATQAGEVKKSAASFFDLGNSLGDIIRNLQGIGVVTGFLQNLNPWADDSKEKIDELRTSYQDLSSVLVRAAGGPFDATQQALEDQAEAAAKADRQIGYLRDTYRQFSEITLQQVADEKTRQEAAARAATTTALTEKQKRIAYRETAKELRGSLREAVADARKELQDAKDDADEFGRSFAFSFGVSLAGAYDTAKEAENDYTAALQGRKDAYDALDVAKQGNDLGNYLRAVQDVATAEQAVTDAQKARITPAAAFATQIEAAKTFGANLKTLVGQGLGQAGLQQLLDLGPTAGAEVTKALLEGTAGFTVGGLNQSLADLATVQGGLAAGITAQLAPKGAIASAQSMVDALSSASIGAPGVGQGFTINIVAGVGDPVEIGRQVKNVLGQYDQRAGTLVVQGPKKKGKR